MTPPARTIIEKIKSAWVRLARRQEHFMDRMADLHGDGLARPVRYGVAVLMVALGFGARELIGPPEIGLQFVTFFPAVALSAIFCGFWPGMLATALAALLVTWRYQPPYGAFPFAFEGATLLSNLAFLLDELVVCGAIQAMHNHFRNFRRASARLGARLTENRNQLHAIVEGTTDAIFLQDGNGRYLHSNRAHLALSGKRLDQVIGRDAFSVFPPGQARAIRDSNAAALTAGTIATFEEVLSAPGGGERILLTTKGPLFDPDGRLSGLFSISRDITERRLAEDALRESQEKLSLFIEGAPAGIAMFDRDMRYLAVSRRFLDDSRIAEHDVIGRCHYDVFPAIHDQWRAIHQRCLAGESHRCEEEAFRRADGSVHWLRWEVRPWHTAAGAIGGVILFSESINARKQSEHELRLAKAEAEQANHAKSRFLAAASHDLRQPLAALALYVGALKNKLAPADAPLLSNMVDCVDNLNELLTDLLDISKLDAGVVQPDVCDFAVADLLAGLAAVHAPEARLKGLRYRARAASPHARTDPRLLRRIVGNLVANAVRYTERGGVLVGCRRRDGKNWIEVWDTGIGFPQDKHDEIFEEFRQLGRDERNRGSGLGLAIAAKSAALLGLQIRVRSQPGKGSLFAVELPPGRAGAAAPAPATASASAPARRVGVVDDNPAVLQALACSLRDMGHQVVAAADTAQLLERLAGAAPAIVVSDFRLAGGQTGLDVIAAARAAYGPQLPALLITGDTDPNLMRGMSEHGILVQHKPLAPDALRTAIEQVIAGAAGIHASSPAA